MKFTTTIEAFITESTNYGPFFKIPNAIAEALLENTKDKRVQCILNNEITIPRAISKKDDFYYVLMNQEILKKLQLDFGSVISVTLSPDVSKYGMPICEEFQEMLLQDPEGETLFDKLTPGKQRSLIFYINKIKSSQLKIERSFIILEHLKNNKGKLDHEKLQQDIKNYNNNLKF
jgi:Bacteriocin-protection, YdeI or OmpD-Associated